MAIKKSVLLPMAAAVAAMLVFGLTSIFPVGNQAIAGSSKMDSKMSEMTTSTSSNNSTTTSSLVMNNGTLDCKAIAHELGGIPVPTGKVCDVVVVRQSPQITGMNGLNMNQFTLMNSVIEFLSNGTSHNVYAMGDFALLETEMNQVLSVVKDNNWTVTGIHNHMINETPKTTFMHWETTGNINTIVDQTNQAFAKTSIKGTNTTISSSNSTNTSNHTITLSAKEVNENYRWSSDGMTNPTLHLSANTEYTIQVNNPTDTKHELVIENQNEKEIASSGVISPNDSAQISFTTPSSGSTLRYYCEFHPDSMRGTIDVK